MRRSACIFGCAGTELSRGEQAFFAEMRPLGFILFSRNGQSRDEVHRLTDQLREAAGEDVLILTDHEGGRVQRFTGKGWRSWMPALEQCMLVRPENRLRALWLRYRIIAAELQAAGIDVNCVPVADVATANTHEVLRNRCYSDNAHMVADAAGTVAEACLAGGVLPVLKHIPGHGKPSVDSHLRLPETDASLQQLEEEDFLPFRRLGHLPLGMTAHVLYRAIDSERAATHSAGVVELIRNSIGFQGLLMTDDLSMQALAGSMAVRCRRALEAGCDVILHCNGEMPEMREIASAVGELEGMSLFRAERAMAAKPPPDSSEPDRLEAEYSALMRLGSGR
ncbi:MAG: beta-N-acetylhexosaminidase [Rhodobacteraceae bacterium]|nr:beta-N-acetylhexosaminidase [Paracoccaceae bacterium]